MVMLNGSDIRAKRKAAGVKAKDLADALGITPEHLSRVENGHRPVTAMLALATAAALKKKRA